MTKTTQTAPPDRTVEIVDLLNSTAHPETDKDAVRRMMDQPGLVICTTWTAAAGSPPRRVFHTPEAHCGKAPPAGVAIEPVGIHLRRSGEPDARFTPDLPASGRDAYDYAGWLPLALIRHPDGKGPHHAWATGDTWIGDAPPGDATTRRGGVQACALTAQVCLTEALHRRHACWWNDPPPAAWPLTGTARLHRLRRQAEQLCEAAHTLCYDLKVIERRAQAGKHDGLPLPADEDAAALHRIARVAAATGILVS